MFFFLSYILDVFGLWRKASLTRLAFFTFTVITMEHITKEDQDLLRNTEAYLSAVADGLINISPKETLHNMIEELYDFITKHKEDDIFCDKTN